MKKNYITVSTLCTALLLAALTVAACNDSGLPSDTVTDAPTVTDGPFTVDTVEPPETEPVTEEVTEAATEPEVTEPVIEDVIVNPLTGLETDVDYRLRRPVAIMINNIKVATPQEGVSYADIMYECVVEGQQTRLMMVVSDYESLPTVGSVRSSREYYLDFAANHDAIYMHAGGSNQAYVEIKSRKVDNLDGVNDNGVSYRCFWRDAWRKSNMGFEHSLMTSGEKITVGIEYKKCNTELAENFDSPLDFVPLGTVRVPEGGDATYLRVSYSGAHKPYFEYSATDGVYYRWQFLGDKHIDNTAGVQLSFTNIIVLYLPTYSTGDSYLHMDVSTTGTGEGYYLTAGKYEKITWEKVDEDTPVKLYNEDGEELLVNRGKTFFQICSEAMASTTEIR